MDQIKNVRFWIFDLDNTLYPASTNLFPKIDKLMTSFITEHLKVDNEEAVKIKNEYLNIYNVILAPSNEYPGIVPWEIPEI